MYTSLYLSYTLVAMHTHSSCAYIYARRFAAYISCGCAAFAAAAAAAEAVPAAQLRAPDSTIPLATSRADPRAVPSPYLPRVPTPIGPFQRGRASVYARIPAASCCIGVVQGPRTPRGDHRKSIRARYTGAERRRQRRHLISLDSVSAFHGGRRTKKNRARQTELQALKDSVIVVAAFDVSGSIAA